jgi:hypothetical protein
MHGARLLAPCNLGEPGDQPNDKRVNDDPVGHVRYAP